MRQNYGALADGLIAWDEGRRDSPEAKAAVLRVAECIHAICVIAEGLSKKKR